VKSVRWMTSIRLKEWVPDVSYLDRFVTRRFVPGFS